MGISINVTATSVSLRHLSTNGTRPSERLQSSVVGGHRRVCAMLARASLAAMLLRESYSTEVYYVLLYMCVCMAGDYLVATSSGNSFYSSVYSIKMEKMYVLT